MNTINNTELKQILVVDDEHKSVMGTIRELERRGFSVDSVATQDEASYRLRSRPYDAVLLDMKVPIVVAGDVMGDTPRAEYGLEVLHSLRSGQFETEGARNTTPVFIVTALPPGASELEKAQTLGVEKIFYKPVSPILVAETVRIALRQ